MLDLYKNIKERRLALGLSQMGLAEKVGYTDRSSIAKIEAGKIDLPQSKIIEFADALQTSPGELMGLTIKDNPTEGSHINSVDVSTIKNIFPIETKRFPLLGTVACGEPIFDDAYFESYVNGGDINADFCLKCKGDSMIGARIEDGDIVFIHEQPDVENGEIAAVIIDDEATLKRVNKNTPGFIFLMPENSNYEPIVINLSEENEFHSIRILGKAVAFQGDVK